MNNRLHYSGMSRRSMTLLVAMISLALSLSSCAGKQVDRKPYRLEDLAIEVFDTTREAGYTNKQAGVFYTETNGEHRTGWQGWRIMSAEMLDDYRITIGGKELRKRDVHLARVFPHQLKRAYPSGPQETVTLLDSVNALVVELEKLKGKTLSLGLLFPSGIKAADLTIKKSRNILLAARTSHLQRTEKENYPVWIGALIAGNDGILPITAPLLSDTGNVPVSLSAELPDDRCVIIFVAGNSEEETIALAQSVASDYNSHIAERKARMEALLNHSYVRTNDEEFNKALGWAKLSMDALIMNQLKKGIFAGLPWFDNYWGRDSYISLPGATLVTGDFAEAREILQSFADWQDRDETSPTYGRIPNLVTTTSISYNTTDGTLWFTRALRDYVKYSNDTTFAREMYPTIFLAIETNLKSRLDENNFLTHGDAETWMDAVGPDGPWSPRGNRANDIQALWYQTLQIGIWLAQVSDDYSSAGKWNGILRSVQESFNERFVNAGNEMIYDHLNADGTPDPQMRPNQLFALSLIEEEELRARLFARITDNLVYPYGVASLSQDDAHFHPYHHYAPYYVQDAAYHNGIVWTWLAGRWIDAATEFNKQDLAFQLTDTMAQQILRRGAVGTLSELLDAAPRANESRPRLSGTYSQAWSLAEFIRVWYQSYLGITVDAASSLVSLRPRLPKKITHAITSVAIADTRYDIEYDFSGSEKKIILSSPQNARKLGIELEWKTAAGPTRLFASALDPGSTTTIMLDDNGRATVETPTGTNDLDTTFTRFVHDFPFLADVKFASPTVHPALAALKGPAHKVLTNSEVKASPAQASLLYASSDPVGDDVGPAGTYLYPKTPTLRPGSLDITHFEVSGDAKNTFFTLAFRELSNPGWHPEYGFQLTYVAIAIDKDGVTGSGERSGGMNSLYTIDPKFAYEEIIYVGGGLRLVDKKGNIIAEYLPQAGDEKNPLGNSSAKSISFSLPNELLGTPSAAWNYTLLVGCQDDHGGAGIGEFRSVEAGAGEWTGGGKARSGDSNVYDVLPPKEKKE